MNSTDRIKCSTDGCRRSFAATARLPIGTEIVCAKCWRAVKSEAPMIGRLHKEAYHRFNRLLRRGAKRFLRDKVGDLLVDSRWDRLLDMAHRRENRRWRAVKREAKRLLDSGYHQRGRRPKKSPSKRSALERDPGAQRADQLFMSSFKALKSSTSAKR